MTLFGPATRDLRRGKLGERRGGSLCSPGQPPRFLSNKIKHGLTHFQSAHACRCVDLAHSRLRQVASLLMFNQTLEPRTFFAQPNVFTLLKIA